jgi:hypothetical protein
VEPSITPLNGADKVSIHFYNLLNNGFEGQNSFLHFVQTVSLISIAAVININQYE